MSLSTTRTFIQSRNDIILSALRRVRALKPSETPSSQQLTDVSMHLNAMVKSWQTESIFLWTQSEATVPLVASTTTYNLSADIIDVEGDGYIRINGYDNPVLRLTRDEYLAIPTKSMTGRPIQFFVDFQLANPVLSVYYVPDIAYTFTYNKVLKLQDFTIGTDNPDFPVMWSDALMLNLAYRIAPMYAFPINEMDYLRFDATDAKSKGLMAMKGVGEGAASMRIGMNRRGR